MKNEEVVSLSNRYLGYLRFVKRSVMVVVAIIFVKFVFEGLSKFPGAGFLFILFNVLGLLLLMFVLYGFVFSLILMVMNLTVGMVFRNRALEMLRKQFGKLIRSDFERTWLEPGIFSIDCQERFVLFSSNETGYVAIRINSDDILSTKIERDISFSTRTEATHSVDGWSGGGRSFSQSVSVQREGISLEIAYKGSDNLPYVVVVPFDEDRISAERAQYMIQMFA